MTEVLPALPDLVWDVVMDGEGFSAEGSAERALAPDEFAAFETATARMRPVVRPDGGRQLRGMATVDDGALWIYVHAIGPGRYDDDVARRARELVVDLWRSIHMAAAAS